MDEEAIEAYLAAVNALDPEAPEFKENPGFRVFSLLDLPEPDDELPRRTEGR